MRTGLRNIVIASTLSAGISMLTTTDAQACGGCFHLESDPESTVVTGHRMVFSISPKQTVLWDQVRYTGSPKEFAWVLPIKKGARLELGSNAWFDALEAATTTRILAPRVDCAQPTFGDSSPGYGCCGGVYTNSDGAGEGFIPEAPVPSVTVVNRETIGPYEVVTLSTAIPGVLVDWLKKNGFAVDADIGPVIDKYTAEGFDFIAMRLAPGSGVQDMKPVRVISEGASPALPLRMVAAGTGANTAITLFVVGEGRWEAENFPNATINRDDLAWDFALSGSNYAEVRAKAIEANQGRTWLTTYASYNELFQERFVITGQDFDRRIDIAPIAQLYVQAGQSTGENFDGGCFGNFLEWSKSMNLVVDTCDMDGAGGMGGGGMGGGGAGGMGGGGDLPCMVEEGQIDRNDFACNGPMGPKSFDDLAVALTGLHPGSVWITRLEANLPRAALQTDLALKPASQSLRDNWITALQIVNPPCTLASASLPPEIPNSSSRNRHKRTELAAAVALLACAGLVALRRVSRRPKGLLHA